MMGNRRDIALEKMRERAKELKCLYAVDGWGKSLAFINYERTGYKVDDSLIDLHIITDKDIKEGSSYSSMIGASENSARLLKSITE